MFLWFGFNIYLYQVVTGLHGGAKGTIKESKKEVKLNTIKMKLQNRHQDQMIMNKTKNDRRH